MFSFLTLFLILQVACFKELLRVTKPGGYFGSYEVIFFSLFFLLPSQNSTDPDNFFPMKWCMTDKYDPNNEEHNKLKWMIEIGDGLPDIASTHEIVEALKEAGWEVLESEDLVCFF